MAIRKIIQIDEGKCDGCGLCIPNCAEGALQIVDGKAKIVKDIYCDGLGDCLGHCPQNALSIIEREADEFDVEAVKEFLASQGKTFEPDEGGLSSQQNQTEDCDCPTQGVKNFIARNNGGGCPGSRPVQMNGEKDVNETAIKTDDIEIRIKSQLRHWPVQLSLVPVDAPYFDRAELLITADCVPVAYPDYHLDLLKGKVVVIGCPKLDDNRSYANKLTEITKRNNLKSITVAYMEVPCCQGIVRSAEIAVANSGKNIRLNKVKISLEGKKL